jgi:NADH-quinone oxidoreductase subunit H
VVPAKADKPVFELAPFVALLPYLLVLLVIPVSPSHSAHDLDVGVFFALAVISIAVIGPLMAGWSSANKYALLGGLRVGAQLMAYELPLVLAAASVAMAAGTLSLGGITHEFRWWWIPYQGVGMVVFFTAALAELRRPPFDMPVADAEIVFGPYTEYTGLRFGLFILAEYAGIIVFSALTAVLFLGGWRGPFLDSQLGWLWLLAKTVGLSFIVIWLRVAYPRMRADQLQRWPRHEQSLRVRPGEGSRGHRAHAHQEDGHPRVPRREARSAAAQPRCHRAVRGELHIVHVVCPGVPRLVHLHRLAQGNAPGTDRGRPRAHP